MNSKHFFIAFIATMLMALVCPQQTFSKDKYYLGHLYSGKMKKNVPKGYGYITIDNLYIRGTFEENNTITDAFFDVNDYVYYNGDITFDESNEIILKKEGIIRYFCNIKKLKDYEQVDVKTLVKTDTIREDKKCTSEALFPDVLEIETANYSGLAADQIFPFSGMTLKRQMKKNKGKYVLNDDDFSFEYKEKKYWVKIEKKHIASAYAYNIRCEDGSYYSDYSTDYNNKEFSAFVKIGYPDGDCCFFIYSGYYNTDLIGMLRTPGGIWLLPDVHKYNPNAQDINEINVNERIALFPNMPEHNNLSRNSEPIKAFLDRKTEKPDYEVGIIMWNKFKNMTKEQIADKIKDVIKNYPHKEQIAIFDTSNYYNISSFFHWHKSYYRWNTQSVPGGEVFAKPDDGYYGEYINGEIRTWRELANQEKEEIDKSERQREQEFQNALSEVGRKLSKKYNSTQVKKCLSSNYEGLPISLVKEFINTVKPIVDPYYYIDGYDAEPTTKTILQYGRGVRCYVIQQGPVKTALFVVGGKVVKKSIY